MASDLSFVEFVREQMSGAREVSFKRMFGEYGLYCDGKMVALVCDNQLFVKPTAAGRAHLGSVQEAPPYSCAKPYFLVSDLLDDREALARLIAITADDLPLPPPKKPKARKTKS